MNLPTGSKSTFNIRIEEFNYASPHKTEYIDST